MNQKIDERLDLVSEQLPDWMEHLFDVTAECILYSRNLKSMAFRSDSESGPTNRFSFNDVLLDVTAASHTILTCPGLFWFSTVLFDHVS